MNIALGTAQFGLAYGISNQTGQVSRDEVIQILSLSRKCGINMLDTAAAYGSSEFCLGELGVKGFNIVTKLRPIPKGLIDVAGWVDSEVRASLHRLNVDSVYGVLLHRSDNLISSSGKLIMNRLQRFKEAGSILKIGVSIYHPRELDLIAQEYAIDIVQAPFNVLDRRIATSGWLRRLHKQGIEVHARSIFLQGLLVMSRDSIPHKFNRWFDVFNRWHDWLEANNLNATDACLAYAASQTAIERVVLGVQSCAQLDELTKSAIAKVPLDKLPDISSEDEKLINPSNWSLL